MDKNDIFYDMQDFFNVSSLEDVAERLGYSRNTARTWRYTGLTPNVLRRYENAKNGIKKIKNDDNGYWINKISHSASAGTLTEIDGVEVYDTDERIFLPSHFFKAIQASERLRMVEVVGDSMEPKLKSGDWVIIDVSNKFLGDGMYVINFRNILMVKTLQFKPNGSIVIKSENPKYESYYLDDDTQDSIYIIGRVIKSII